MHDEPFDYPVIYHLYIKYNVLDMTFSHEQLVKITILTNVHVILVYLTILPLLTDYVFNLLYSNISMYYQINKLNIVLGVICLKNL